jgi:uncharacterized membrane protein YfcA
MRAYVHAQEANAFRRLLWRRLAVMMVAWLIGAWLLSLSLPAIVVGLVTLAVPALWAFSYERRFVRDLFR